MMLVVLLRWRHRGTFLAGWEDVARLATDHVTLRPGYTRYSPVLRDYGVSTFRLVLRGSGNPTVAGEIPCVPDLSRS